MILVTLGTQDKKFTRLLQSIDKQILNGNIKDKVIVQAGYSSDFQSDNMQIFDLIPKKQFEKLLKECDILITHGGVGTIMSGIKNGKKIIAVARLKKYGEHTNNHQFQIIENFKKEGYILSLDNFDDFDKMLKKVKKFQPKKWISNTNKFTKSIKAIIDKYL